MIGIFGLRRAEPKATADLGKLAERLPARYAIQSAGRRGAALGRAAHDAKRAGGLAISADEKLCAVVCGEIFNIEEFANSGAGIETSAELLLRLTAAGDLARLAQANGQFCAAIYDRSRHALTLITDRLATHPVHVWERDGEIVFATQLYALIGDPRVERRADPLAMAELFSMQRTIGRVTPFAGIEALPAACIATFEREGARESIYWRLAWRRPDFSRREGARILAQALTNAVARQSRPEIPSLLLSGGVDSRMVLAASGEVPPCCWTTASFESNPELALARRVAALAGAEHHALVTPPEDTLAVLDDAVVASGGLYPASTPVAAFTPRVAAGAAVALTGHGLDYMIRGYYLPTRFADIAGSHTRLPVLRPIPKHPTGRDVLENLRQGPPRATIDRIVVPRRRADWWHDQARALDDSLRPWLGSDEPYNAWDAFILHAVSKHYAFTSMMAVRADLDLRIPAFDNEVFEVYLRLPPAWRCSGRVALSALRHLAPDLAALPNANTGFRAVLHPWAEVGGLLGRGALRRLGVARRRHPPASGQSLGSWQNATALYRDDPAHRQRLTEIRGRLDALALDMIDRDALAACIDEHLNGAASHTKLLRQLLTHDAWVRRFGVTGLA